MRRCIAKADVLRTAAHDYYRRTTLAEKSPESRGVSCTPHADEVLSARCGVNSAASEQSFQPIHAKPFVGDLPINDADHGISSVVHLRIAKQIGSNRRHSVIVAPTSSVASASKFRFNT